MSRIFPNIPENSLQRAMRVVAAALVMMALAGCSGSNNTSTTKAEPRSRSAADGRADFEARGGGISLNNLFQAPRGSTGLPVNALLWRASLDTLSVIPLASVDTFGGTIITEWYANPSDPTRRIKVSVFVLDQELRSDGIRAEVYVQDRSGSSSEWIDAGRDPGFAARLEDLILTRAREIRSSGISETN